MSEFRQLTDTELTDWITESAARLREIAAVVGSREPVPACEPWTMRQLVAHVISGLSGWYTHNLTHGDAPLDLLAAWDAQPELPRGNADRLCYLEHVAGEFRGFVESLDLDAPCYVFQDVRTARGWLLRAATECAIHVQDAEETLGGPTPFTPERAATSIDETLRYMWRGALVIRSDPGGEKVPEEPFGLFADDLDLGWHVTKAPDRLSVEHIGSRAELPALSVAGDQAQLIAWMWGRSEGEGLSFGGERGLVDAWNLSAGT
jgi:uncharacterized protein (TIGR03083 family)